MKDNDEYPTTIQENNHNTWNDFMSHTKFISNNQLNVLHVNIRSMLKNFAHLEYVVSTSIHTIHILVLTEVNISDDCKNLFHLSDYEMHTELRRHRKGGGVVLYVHNSVCFTRLPTSTIYFECIAGEVNTSYGLKIGMCAVYRPPTLSKPLFIEELSRVVDLCSRKQNYMLLGDMNINLKNNDPVRTSYLNAISDTGMECGISQYTRIESKADQITKSCIDHIFARVIDCKEALSSVINYKIADHYITGLVLVYNARVKCDSNKLKTRIDNDKLQNELCKINFKSALSLHSPSEILKFIAKNFCEVYDKSKLQSKVKSGKRQDCKWTNDRMLYMCNKKQELLGIWLQDESVIANRLLYNKYRNKTNKYINKIRNNYIMKEVSANFKNSRKLWEIINNICGKVCHSIDTIICKYFKSDLGSLCNSFAYGFDNNVKNICYDCDVPLLTNTYKKTPTVAMRMTRANNNVISTIIKHLNKNKSPGIDKIRVRDIQCISSEITPVITHLINCCLATSSYPDNLKTGIIRPIHKKGSYNVINNYRPITILSSIDKIVERYLGTQINNFLISNNVINDKQYGFQKGRSTSQLLSKFTDDVNDYLNAREQVLVVFIDFSKAFDTLRYSTLYDKLEQNGIQGPLLEWFRDYHTNRHTLVRLGNAQSDKIPTVRGTAQGSILGPTEYLLYVNEMCDIFSEGSVYQFADDTCLITHSKDIIEAQKTMQHNFNILCKWAHDVGLVINSDKTKVVHIHSPYIKTTHETSITAHEHKCMHNRFSYTNDGAEGACSCPSLQVVEQHVYLGLIIDNHFNWGPQIESVTNRLRSINAKLSILKFKVPYRTLRILYLALADSIISYGLTSYGRTYKTYLNKIYKLQVNLLKTIVSNKIRDKYKDNDPGLFCHCKVMSVFNKSNMLIILDKFEKISLLKKKRTSQSRVLSYLPMYQLPRSNNAYGMRTAEYILPATLNKIPDYLHADTSTINKCKQYLKEYYLSNF